MMMKRYRREDKGRKGKIQVSITGSGRHVVITHSRTCGVDHIREEVYNEDRTKLRSGTFQQLENPLLN